MAHFNSDLGDLEIYKTTLVSVVGFYISSFSFFNGILQTVIGLLTIIYLGLKILKIHEENKGNKNK